MTDVNFNLFRNRKLLLYTQLQQEVVPENFKKMQNNIEVMNLLKRHMDLFIGKMEIPTYNNRSHYNFHDTLTALVKYVFSV